MEIGKLNRVCDYRDRPTSLNKQSFYKNFNYTSWYISLSFYRIQQLGHAKDDENFIISNLYRI